MKHGIYFTLAKKTDFLGSRSPRRGYMDPLAQMDQVGMLVGSNPEYNGVERSTVCKIIMVILEDTYLWRVPL